MTFNYLISICNPLSVEGPEPGRIGGIAHDSRKVDHDYVFVALRGYQTDGHQFIDQAIENGARTILHDQPVSDKQSKVCYVKVDNTRALLGPLTQAYYDNPGDRLTVIGITGTNGKTTVATLAYQMLRKLKERPSLMGTNGNIIDGQKTDSNLTTQDAVDLAENMHSMVQAGSTHLVMEVSSHALEQRRTDGIHFTAGAFTNISHEHLDYHGSMDQYVKAKKRLFDRLGENAAAIVNADDDHADVMIGDCYARMFKFGFESDAPIPCQILSHDLSGIRLKIDDTELDSPLCGKFNAYNLAQTFIIGTALDYNKKEIAKALSTCRGAEGRLQRLNDPSGDRPVVYVDYAHTPDALENVLQTLHQLKSADQKLRVIFGCGGDRDRAKRPKMAEVAETWSDAVMVTSDNPRSESPDRIIDEIFEGFSSPERIERNPDRREAIDRVIQEADPEDIILIAGKGHETHQVIGDRKVEFDDRKAALESLELPTNARNGEVA